MQGVRAIERKIQACPIGTERERARSAAHHDPADLRGPGEVNDRQGVIIRRRRADIRDATIRTDRASVGPGDGHPAGDPVGGGVDDDHFVLAPDGDDELPSVR